MPRFKNRIIFCLQIWLLLDPLLSWADEVLTEEKIPDFFELCPNNRAKPTSVQEKRLVAHEQLVEEQQEFIYKVLLDEKMYVGKIWNRLDADPKHRRLKIDKDDTSWQCLDLIGRNLQGADFSKAKLWHTAFYYAQLQGANFKGVDLQLSELAYAYMSGADLSSTNLIQTDLHETNLRRATLSNATLGGFLTDVQLQGANLFGAHFQWVDLKNASLRGADLRYTKLGGVDFKNADLSYACLAMADFTEADDTDTRKNPNSKFNIANARGLEKVLFDNTDNCNRLSNNREGQIPTWEMSPFFDGITYGKSSNDKENEKPIKGIADSPPSRFEDLAPIGFYPLATELRQKGYIEQARRITYAYKHNEQRYLRYETGRLWDEKQYYESVLTSFKYIIYLAFDFTTHWGMHPFLALKHLGYLILFGGFFYSLGAVTKGNVLKIKICNRFLPRKPTRKEGEYSFYNLTDYTNMSGRKEYQHIRILGLALWISAINSLRIGWKDLDLGTWISQMHPKQITFETNGWMHTFLIMQSIIGKYFLVSFLLTFFGAPFNNW